MEAFVYCWTDKLTNKLYVGSHKGTDNDGYICSSKEMLEEYRKRPKDFSRQIIAHGIEEDIRALERTILKSVNASFDEQFYNRHNGGCGQYNRTPEGNLRMIESKIGVPKSEETKKRISETRKLKEIKPPCSFTSEEVSGANNYFYNSKRIGELNPMYGKVQSEKTRKLIKDKYVNQKKIICEYCEREFFPSHYGRYHGKRCKIYSNINNINNKKEGIF